ncbi:hypothetical protein B0H34DRAFT_801006 [Crassisporium funariophilum]|nr:hypothetical protein B0H34DRAFT_801006 [Crassisporium funariophilum]
MSDSSTGDVFSITDAQINFANILAEACTIPGTCVCFLVLFAYGIAACIPRARQHMDRVSFRLLVYTLIFNVLFGIAYAATPAAPGPGCNFGAFCVNFFLSFSTFFTTCIAINLQLVLVHHVNGQRMEKYYVIGTTLLSLVLNVPTFALHQFGWDEGSSTCWYKNSDPTLRLHWIIGTQSIWIALAATIETTCSGIILVYMYLYQRNTRALFDEPMRQNNQVTMKATDTTRVATHKQAMDITRDPRYRGAILRIALYPIISLMVNYSTVALDLNNSIRGDFRLLVLDLFLYGIRTLAYGIAAAADPSFITAIREILGKNKTSVYKASTRLEFATANAERSTGTSERTAVLGDTSQSLSRPDLSPSERETISTTASEKMVKALQTKPEAVNGDPEMEGSPYYDYEAEMRNIERQL